MSNPNKIKWTGCGHWKKYKKNNHQINNRINECDINVNVEYLQECPFHKWQLYFPNEMYNKDSLTVKYISASVSFLNKLEQNMSIEQLVENKSYLLNVESLNQDQDFISIWENFWDDLTHRPNYTLGCLGLAIHQYALDELNKNVQNNCTIFKDLPMIHPRIINFGPLFHLKHLKAETDGRLILVHGTVIKASCLKFQCSWLAFSCNTCYSIQNIKQPDGIFTKPKQCNHNKCHGRSFSICRNSPLTQTINCQTIRVQELQNDDHRESGRVPRTVECELTNDLVYTCIPGDVITITGIVKKKLCNSNKLNSVSKESNIFMQYIEVISIQNNKNQSKGKITSTEFHFTMRDYYCIQKLHSKPYLFECMVNSLCPSIYGHEMVKAGMLLSLFGGSNCYLNQTRGDIHILVIGDPGLGKSQMLQSVCNISPRGVFVCGSTCSSAGLTVSLTREKGTDFSLEAGAVVLADQGVCCIDEFDKMTQDHNTLLEAMEQQTISIAKGGVICSLPCRTTIMAAANPISGHYNCDKSVLDNLKMSQAMLSRFDLIFLLIDTPDELTDKKLTAHVLNIHSNKIKQTQNIECSSKMNSSLKERLSQFSKDSEYISQSELRKYIAYARKYVSSPTLSNEAKEMLQQFFIELRSNNLNYGIPITIRQLESCIRLAQARAKVELREQVTAKDAYEIIELLNFSLVKTQCDEFSGFGFKKSIKKTGIRAQSKKLLTELLKHGKTERLFSIDQMKLLSKQLNIATLDFYNVVELLNNEAIIIKKGNNIYELKV
ncbi:Nucleic acid-binding, OB-fold,Mini-chromosome maintenance protein,P-loop containing nucleoside [Cinara cedri]|uniref:DNA helicase MCM8 n=1 Tax=Cinara cedri TaxID=506608 RepID=A0A5E4NKP8_9HEMI|nr:Nucleic acid-binding, OB-fold,Mini-chromosome maintenance protein,P-loop containing nucleoside [Cinara cedri]